MWRNMRSFGKRQAFPPKRLPGRQMCIRDRIMADRKQLKNPNGLILGTPGSGKSFSAKREMTNAFLITEAVSYTHLDVYKRQGLHQPKATSRNGNP